MASVSWRGALFAPVLALALLLAPIGGARARADVRVRLAAGGDIACRAGAPPTRQECHQASTARTVRDLAPSIVAALGDNQYETGTLSDFQRSFDQSWGLFRPLIRPVPGNHEYSTPGASGYFGYFGTAAGDPRAGYYSYDAGPWHIVALNSNCSAPGVCSNFERGLTNSTEASWLSRDLDAHPNVCTLAYWHHPLFSSSVVSSPGVRALWSILYSHAADVVLNGHDHNYERFALQDPLGRPDPRRGIREFVVGTGGRSHTDFRSLARNSEVRVPTAFGVLLLDLTPGAYGFSFHAEDGRTILDQGSTACHAASPPIVAGLSLRPSPVRASRSSKLLVSLSKPATVTVRVERLRGTRFRRIGSLRRRALGGTNRLTIKKIGHHSLRPGRYRAIVTATDSTGRISPPRVLHFRVSR